MYEKKYPVLIISHRYYIFVVLKKREIYFCISI